ncbi:glycosyltransferase [Metamycoplasma canadense]|nr:glycosyltransferase [Metamycoplasma canadense]
MQKKLTIIIPIYNPIISLDKILNNIYKQKSQNFDVIITIDKPKDKDFYEIDKIQNKLKDSVKFIFNTSHQHVVSVIQEALKLVKTNYVYVLYSYCELKTKFTQNIDDFLNSLKELPDFIEVPGFSTSISHSLIKSNILSNLGVVNLEKNKYPYALVTPFIFNCLMKKEIMEQVVQSPKIKDSNQEYSSNFVFKALLYSKTFAYFNDTWIENLNYGFLSFNPKSLTRGWNSIFNQFNIEDQDKKNALEFAKFINYCYYIAGILGTIKTRKNELDAKNLKNIKVALLQEIQTQKQFWTNQLKTNPYFEQFNIQELFDLTNGLVEKWDLILKKFLW